MFLWIGNSIYETVGMTILMTTLFVGLKIILSRLFAGGFERKYNKGPRHYGRRRAK